MTDRSEVIARLKAVRDEIVELVEGASDEAWSSQVYEDGWTARDLLSHVASTSGVASFIMTMARSGGGRPTGGFDDDANEAFNRQQVDLRNERSVGDVLDEVRAHIQRDVQAVEGTPDELLQQHYAAWWGVEGSVAEVIVASLDGHLGEHIADLRGALAS